MKTSRLKGAVAAVFMGALSWCAQSQACDVTLAAGANIAAAVSSNTGKDICLSPGTYDLGAQGLHMPDGTWLEGMGQTSADVVVRAHGQPQSAISTGASVRLHNFTLTGEHGTYGVLSYHKTDNLFWSLKIEGFNIGLGVVAGQKIEIWDTFFNANGTPGNGVADPNVWITDSKDVRVLYGALTGRADGPGGDGEFAAYNSSNVQIDGLHVIDSGASAIYLVGCTDCSVKNAVIERPDEWGLDIVNGSTRFVAQGNSVSWAGYGGSVFDASSGSTATYMNNTFNNNRRHGVGSCNGINVKGSLASVTQSGNVSVPTGVICPY